MRRVKVKSNCFFSLVCQLFDLSRYSSRKFLVTFSHQFANCLTSVDIHQQSFLSLFLSSVPTVWPQQIFIKNVPCHFFRQCANCLTSADIHQESSLSIISLLFLQFSLIKSRTLWTSHIKVYSGCGGQLLKTSCISSDTLGWTPTLISYTKSW